MLLLLAPISAALPGSRQLGSQADPAAAEAPSLLEVYAEFAELRNSEFEHRARELWESAPETTFEALVLRAGRPIPPILSGTGRGDRERQRAEAIAILESKLDAAALSALVAGDRTTPLLQRSAMFLAGELGIVAAAPGLAAGLDSLRPELRSAARRALFDLYLEWFATSADYEAHVAKWSTAAPNAAGRAAAERYEALARALQIELLKLDPERASSALDDPDPRIRAVAAKTMGQAVLSGALEREATETLLLARVAAEEDVLAFSAQLDALVALGSGDEADSEALARLREALFATAARAHPDFHAPAARILGRLDWRVDGPASPAGDHVLVPLLWLAARLSEPANTDALSDPDGLVATLRALRALAEQARSGGVELDGVAAKLSPRVLALVESIAHARRVRVAAALCLPAVHRSGDLAPIEGLLGLASTEPELRYALVGALGRMARTLDPESEDSGAALSMLIAQTRNDDPDVHRLALNALLSEELSPRVARADAAWFVDWLETESGPELQSKLLGLIGEFGEPRHVDRLLEMEQFDALIQSAPGRVGEIAGVLRSLCGEDPALVMRAARRLIDVRDDGSELRRLREALTCITSLQESAARGLDPSEQRAIVNWAVHFADRGGVGLLGPEAGAQLLDRLVDVHLALAPTAGGEQEALDAFTRARWLIAHAQLDPEAVDAQRIEEQLASALRFARSAPDRLSPTRVQRDRARYRMASGRAMEARDDYLAVLNAEGWSAGGARPSVLELIDLRDAGRLLAELEQENSAQNAFELSERLVARASWLDEAVAVRLEDLAQLVERARASTELASVRRALGLLVQLPEIIDPPVLPAEAELGFLGNGLLDDPERHAALIGLRGELTLAEEALANPAPSPAPNPDLPPVGEAGSGAGEADGDESTTTPDDEPSDGTLLPGIGIGRQG